MRNIWLQCANLLFELNYIQESKEILQEVLLQAKVRLFGGLLLIEKWIWSSIDVRRSTMRKASLCSSRRNRLARASVRTGDGISDARTSNNEESKGFLIITIQFQQVPIDEQDWYRSVATIVESLRQDPNRDSYKQKKVIDIAPSLPPNRSFVPGSCSTRNRDQTIEGAWTTPHQQDHVDRLCSVDVDVQVGRLALEFFRHRSAFLVDKRNWIRMKCSINRRSTLWRTNRFSTVWMVSSNNTIWRPMIFEVWIDTTTFVKSS